MPSPNLHRLISAFLTVAVIASTTVFGVSYWQNRRSIAVAQHNGATLPANAFVESLSGGGVGANIAPRPTNLTEGLAEALAAQVIAKNPQGPVETDGEMTVVFPKEAEAAMSDYLIAHPPSPERIAPVVKETNIKIAEGRGVREAEKYFAEITAAVADLGTVPSSATEDMPQWITESDQAAGAMIDRLSSIEVPEPAADFHKALISLFLVSQNYVRLLESDPIAATALHNDFELLAQEQAQALTESLRRTDEALKATSNASFRNTLARMFGIQVAHAQIETAFALFEVAQAEGLISVPSFSWSQFAAKVGHWITNLGEIAMEIAEEYVKNRLLREMTRQVVNWVLGNGEPQFITNWEAFFRNAADELVGAIIEEAAPKLCGAGLSGYLGNLAEIVRGLMKPIDIGQRRTYAGCTLTDVIQNVEDFRRDIRNGGWLGYGSVFEPQNTFFGQVIELGQRSATAFAQKREALVQKVEQGYKPVETCENGEAPSLGGSCVSDLPEPSKGLGTGPNGNLTVKEPQITAPANVSANLTSRSFDVAYDRIVNGQGWGAMGAFVLDAMISKLVVAGVKGLGGAANEQYTDSGGTETPSLTVEGRTEQMLRMKQQSLTIARAAQTSLVQTVSALTQVQQVCSANEGVAADAKSQLAIVVAARDDNGAKIITLTEDIRKLESFKTLMKTQSLTIKDLEEYAGTYETARAELQKFSEFRAGVEEASESATELLTFCSAGAGAAPAGQ